ncbi:hypothetical protein GCM10010357_20840 [Streptomyces luteireticuli]|uniref:Uncharacterized protein n=1 Tax=Streptomyces luteireticuli TaxID=173858 RepID=A0ABP3IEV1_9ACTN
MGLFHASTHTAGARQPLAEQIGAVAASAASGKITRQLYVQVRRTRRPDAGTTTPGSHGGSRPASIIRSDGGCGAPTKYVTESPAEGT